MTPIKRWSGNQYMHRKSEAYRQAVRRKLGAYHCYVQLGCIAQGLSQHLAINHPVLVWQCFRSWLRTMKTDCVPTEMVVAVALRNSLFDFLRLSPRDQKLQKLRQRIDKVPADSSQGGDLNETLREIRDISKLLQRRNNGDLIGFTSRATPAYLIEQRGSGQLSSIVEDLLEEIAELRGRPW